MIVHPKNELLMDHLAFAAPSPRFTMKLPTTVPADEREGRFHALPLNLSVDGLHVPISHQVRPVDEHCKERGASSSR